MALILETGAGLADSNSYATADEGDEYLDGMMETDWENATSDQKDAALMKATIYIDGAYQDRFKGVRRLSTQALEWPRVGVIENQFTVSDSVIPYKLKWATVQAAIRSLTGALTPDSIESVTEIQVGPIKKVVESASSAPRYPVVERFLKSLCNYSSPGRVVVGR